MRFVALLLLISSHRSDAVETVAQNAALRRNLDHKGNNDENCNGTKMLAAIADLGNKVDVRSNETLEAVNANAMETMVELAGLMNLTDRQSTEALEVLNNLVNTVKETCNGSPTNSSPTDSGSANIVALDPSKLLICREEREGIGRSEESTDYLAGQPVYATEFDEVDPSTLLSDLTSTTGSVVSSLGSAAGDFTVFKDLAGKLSAVGPLLSIITHFVSKSETDITQTIIINGFNAITTQIEILSEQVKNGFLDIRRDLADVSLDGIMSRLQAIDEAYKTLVMAAKNDGVSPGDKLKYARVYRDACNAPQFRAEDLLRNLYGYACGNGTATRDCNAPNGTATGACNFGAKKLQYILDTYKASSKGDILKFNVFRNWIISAMFLAQFHAAACPPPEGSCFDPTKNPVFKAQLETFNSTVQEVIANLNKAESCLTGDPSSIDVEFLNEAPEVTPCSGRPAVECLAPDIYNFVIKRYTQWDWLVVAYRYVNADDDVAGDQSNVSFDSEPNNGKYGQLIFRKDQGLAKAEENTWVHLMYRLKGEPAKPAVDVFRQIELRGLCPDVSNPCDCYKNAGNFLRESDDVVGYPTCCGESQQIENTEILRKQHGYLVIRDASAIERAVGGSGNADSTFYENVFELSAEFNTIPVACGKMAVFA